MVIGFPARHERGSLNCRPGICSTVSSSTTIVVVAEATALVDILKLLSTSVY